MIVLNNIDLNDTAIYVYNASGNVYNNGGENKSISEITFLGKYGLIGIWKQKSN